MLLSGGFPAPPEGFRREWQRSFQYAIAAGQIALEDVISSQAKRQKKKIVLFDRGILDGAAYILNDYKGHHQRNMRAFENIAKLSHDEMLGRYDTVLHLTSSAAHNRYDKTSNRHRFEEADEAVILEEKTLYAWEQHPNRIIIDDPEKADRVARGLTLIQGMLTD
jgi:hypothetical protein